jgi:hypothetical protein
MTRLPFLLIALAFAAGPAAAGGRLGAAVAGTLGSAAGAVAQPAAATPRPVVRPEAPRPDARHGRRPARDACADARRIGVGCASAR